MIALLLSWTKLPQWAMETLVIAAVAGGIWYWQNERYESGIREQRVVDASATAKVRADADQKTAALQVQANVAEQAYEQEHQANLDYQRSHPIEPVRLCLTTAAGGSGLPQAGTTHPGNAHPGATPTTVQPVLKGNPAMGATAGPDISNLLELLAERADEVGAVLREFQTH